MTVPDTPYTRDEMYLSAIADGDSSGIPDRPYTRKEKYLDAIATGDSSGIPETPYTREEMYLDEIARNGGGGGGGGSTLINKSVDANGTYNASDDNADGYKKVTVNVQPDLQSKSVTITENGNSTVQPDSGKDGLSSVAVTVNVPNSYAEGDEGKVVSNGQLVAQTAHAEVTQNGTIDTTLNNSVTVNVPGGSPVVIDLSEIGWEVGAVSGTKSRTYAQNKQTSNARLRPANLIEQITIPFVFTCNWGNGEWAVQYQSYNEAGVSISEFTAATDDFTLPFAPYICIVIRHSDGSLPVTLADIDVIKPKLVFDYEAFSVLLGG